MSDVTFCEYYMKCLQETQKLIRHQVPTKTFNRVYPALPLPVYLMSQGRYLKSVLIYNFLLFCEYESSCNHFCPEACYLRQPESVLSFTICALE